MASDYTIIRVEEQNLRLDTQDGVCGLIIDNVLNSAQVALYLELPDRIQEKIHKQIKEAVIGAVRSKFTDCMKSVATELTHPSPNGWYTKANPGETNES